MSSFRRLLVVAAVVWASVVSVVVADEPFWVVVRLKPGETKELEIALTDGKVGKAVGLNPLGSGRDARWIEPISPTSEKLPPEELLANEQNIFSLGKELDAKWPLGSARLEFRATKEATPQELNLRLHYRAFGGGNFQLGVRVFISEK